MSNRNKYCFNISTDGKMLGLYAPLYLASKGSGTQKPFIHVLCPASILYTVYKINDKTVNLSLVFSGK